MSDVPATVISDLLFGDRVADEAEKWPETYSPSPEGAAFLFPNDRPAWALEGEKDLYTCEVFADRCLVVAMPDDETRDRLAPHWRLPCEPNQGRIAAWLPSIGDLCGARETRENHRPLDMPERGDVVLMLHAASPHASVIVDPPDEDGITNSIDGGQVHPANGARKGIRARQRRYGVEGGVLVCRDVDGEHYSPEAPGPATPVLWVIRARLVR